LAKASKARKQEGKALAVAKTIAKDAAATPVVVTEGAVTIEAWCVPDPELMWPAAAGVGAAHTDRRRLGWGWALQQVMKCVQDPVRRLKKRVGFSSMNGWGHAHTRVQKRSPLCTTWPAASSSKGWASPVD
jgi:hypothetical protein